MVINNIDIVQKLVEMITPVTKDFIDVETLQEICENVVAEETHAIHRISELNIVANELFDEMDKILSRFKSKLMRLDELSNLSVKKINDISSKIADAIVNLSIICTTERYSFVVDLDDDNNEILIVKIKNIDTIKYTFSGITFRQFLSKVIVELNNVAYLKPNKLFQIKLDTFDDDKPVIAEVYLDLEDMITILNLYTVVVNTKFAKVTNNTFAFNLDPQDVSPAPVNRGGLPKVKYVNNFGNVDEYVSNINCDRTIPSSTTTTFRRLSDFYPRKEKDEEDSQ